MDHRIRLEGIYNQNIISTLSRGEINDITFDFRPKSFNFIQLHIFEEMIDTLGPTERAFLQFNAEKHLVIDEIVKTIPDRFHHVFKLEINAPVNFDYFNQLPLPFFWKFDLNENWKELLSLPNLGGFVFSFQTIKELHEQNLLMDFFRHFYQECQMNNRSDIELILSLDWDSDLFPSLLDIVDFSTISLPLNFHVESSYRQFDQKLFQQHFHRFQSIYF